MLEEILMKKLFALVAIAALTLTACGGAVEESTESTVEEAGVVNIYTDRHYDTDQALYEVFEEETGIKVNVIEGKGDELIERLNREGADTEADLLITADAGRLHRAKSMDLLQSVTTDTLNEQVPANLRDKDNMWYGLTMRARVLVYLPEKTDVSTLSTYEALAGEEFAGKILVRSSSNIYNQSLMASFIEIMGEEAATEWAEGVVNNMARNPEGNDRDQAKALVAGLGEVAIMNTYYVGKLINSSDEEERKVGEQIAVFFPNQDSTGTHVNVSGAGVTAHAKNQENAVKFIEFMTSVQAQSEFANANYEYPVNPNVEASELLKSWGEFKAQDINLSILGENNAKAVEVFNKVSWQ
jgi:iron(III) transport system substrate-binding protein